MTKDDFEIFTDPCYFDMWCLKLKSSKDFNNTLHFTKENEARHALQTILNWNEIVRQSTLIKTIKS